MKENINNKDSLFIAAGFSMIAIERVLNSLDLLNGAVDIGLSLAAIVCFVIYLIKFSNRKKN